MSKLHKYQPVGFKVLVKMDKVESHVGKIIIPDKVRDKQQIQQDIGTIEAMGSNAFIDEGDIIPDFGERVMINRHAGVTITDPDDRSSYKLVNDKDINIILGD